MFFHLYGALGPEGLCGLYGKISHDFSLKSTKALSPFRESLCFFPDFFSKNTFHSKNPVTIFQCEFMYGIRHSTPFEEKLGPVY